MNKWNHSRRPHVSDVFLVFWQWGEKPMLGWYTKGHPSSWGSSKPPLGWMPIPDEESKIPPTTLAHYEKLHGKKLIKLR